MKTKLFLIATLLISTITFSQTSKKGYDYYKASSDTKMNKAELVDSIAKDAGSSKKRADSIGRNPQTGKEIKAANKTNDLYLRKRPGRSQGDPIPGIGINKEQGKVRAQTQEKQIRIKPENTNATDYNSSRSNRTTNN